jgi:hypothetical protein
MNAGFPGYGALRGVQMQAAVLENPCLERLGVKARLGLKMPDLGKYN